MTAWADLHDNLRADGINLKWIGNNSSGNRVWNIGGFMAGAQGAFLIPPIKGMVHVPFKSIWHEPAYGAPRFERVVDERREIATRIALCSDSTFGWFGVESRWWEGMTGDDPGWWCIATRPYGELYAPMQLLEAVDSELEDDPSLDRVQVWDVLIGVDGEPRWRQPDVKPPPWVNDMSTTTTVKRDDELLAPNITVGVGRFNIANRGTAPSWPVLTLSAPTSGRMPARYWISDGSTNRMLRVPPLFKGEHIIVDTNPEHRIAISAIDPADDWTKKILRNAELLKWLFGQYGESGVSVLERFHGQGFETPIAPRSLGHITVYSNLAGGRVSVRLPQRFERAIS